LGGPKNNKACIKSDKIQAAYRERQREGHAALEKEHSRRLSLPARRMVSGRRGEKTMEKRVRSKGTGKHTQGKGFFSHC